MNFYEPLCDAMIRNLSRIWQTFLNLRPKIFFWRKFGPTLQSGYKLNLLLGGIQGDDSEFILFS